VRLVLVLAITGVDARHGRTRLGTRLHLGALLRLRCLPLLGLCLDLGALLRLRCLPLLSLCLNLGALLGLGCLPLLRLGGLFLRPRLAFSSHPYLLRLPLLYLHLCALLGLGRLSLLRLSGPLLGSRLPLSLDLSTLLRLGRLPLLILRSLPLPFLLLALLLHVGLLPGLCAIIGLGLSLPRLLTGGAISLLTGAGLRIARGRLLDRLRL
jgi:hypothetical protein